MKLKFLGAAAFLAIAGAASPTHATACALTTAQCFSLLTASDYYIVGLNGSITINSGSINDNILLGDHESTTSSGGGGGKINGKVYYDSTVTGDLFSHIDTPPLPADKISVSTSVTNTMLANAQSVSDWAAAQIANQVFGSTIAGNGGFVSNSTNDDAFKQIHIAIRCPGAFSLYGENLRPRSAQPF